jgi:pimeloyl-ACP methyl ester carboxylesterase
MKKWLRRTAASFVLLAVVALAFAVGAGVLYFVSAWTTSIPFIVLSGLITLAAVAWAGALLDARVWPIQERARFAFWVSGTITVAVGFVIWLSVLRPTAVASSVPSNTRIWKLSTGSVIGYTEDDPPSGVPVRPEPILFLHGGPGLFTAPFDREFYKQFAADGFRVYFFDQAGSGSSGLLPHVDDYSPSRSVADLEAIREVIGAPRVVLIGHSWGSTLAANYMAHHAEHVAKVVFHSPGPIWNISSMHVDYSRTAAGPRRLPSFRLIAAALLFQRNPRSAENLLPQRESGTLLAADLLDPGALVCKDDSSKRPVGQIPPGANFYPLIGIDGKLEGNEDDPHSALRSNQTPAMLAYSECDFLGWKNILDYRLTFPRLRVYYFSKAGHFIQLSQPDLLAKVIRAFLLDAPEIIPAYASDADPRPATAPSSR